MIKREVFHHIVEKLMYISKRAIVDLSTSIVFSCTRVSKSIDEDWEKLR